MIHGPKALIAAIGLSLALAAQADAFPDGPVRIVVPSTMADPEYRLATAVAEALSEQFGTGSRVIVDAQGKDAIGTFTTSVRDGHTLLIARDTVLTRDPQSSPKTALRESDVGSIAIVGEEVLVLACHPAAGIRSSADWLARRKPGKLKLGVLDDPSQRRYAFALSRDEPSRFEGAAYDGTESLGKGVLGNAVDCAVLPLAWAAGRIRQGALHPLGVSTLAKAPQLPDVPTLHAAFGVDVRADTYLLASQAGLPKAVNDLLDAAMARALRSSLLNRRLLKEGFVLTAMTAAEAKSLIRQRRTYWSEQLKVKR